MGVPTLWRRMSAPMCSTRLALSHGSTTGAPAPCASTPPSPPPSPSLTPPPPPPPPPSATVRCASSPCSLIVAMSGRHMLAVMCFTRVALSRGSTNKAHAPCAGALSTQPSRPPPPPSLPPPLPLPPTPPLSPTPSATARCALSLCVLVVATSGRHTHADMCSTHDALSGGYVDGAHALCVGAVSASTPTPPTTSPPCPPPTPPQTLTPPTSPPPSPPPPPSQTLPPTPAPSANVRCASSP